jgi:hypothetical protein
MRVKAALGAEKSAATAAIAGESGRFGTHKTFILLVFRDGMAFADQSA